MTDLWPKPTKLADKMREIVEKPRNILPRHESTPQLYALGTMLGKIEARRYFIEKVMPHIEQNASYRERWYEHVLKWFWSDEPTARLGSLLHDILVEEGFTVQIRSREEQVPEGYDGNEGPIVHWKYQLITISW